jgi:hypothetical protein
MSIGDRFENETPEQKEALDTAFFAGLRGKRPLDVLANIGEKGRKAAGVKGLARAIYEGMKYDNGIDVD